MRLNISIGRRRALTILKKRSDFLFIFILPQCLYKLLYYNIVYTAEGRELAGFSEAALDDSALRVGNGFRRQKLQFFLCGSIVRLPIASARPYDLRYMGRTT